MSTINPENVVALRARRYWSLDRLAEEARLNRQTIHRIETGKITSPHARTIDALARALGSTIDELCGPTLRLPPSPTADGVKSQMNVRLAGFSRNALSVISLRYGIKGSLVLEAAPLLFHCIAEMSLKLRQQKLDDFRARLAELRGQGLGHVPLTDLDRWEIDAALDCEQQSIDAKDVFGAMAREGDEGWDYYGADDIDGDNNPLRNYLATLVDEVGGAEVSSFLKEWGLEYELGREDVLKLMEGNTEAADHVINGRVLLHEIPKSHWIETQQEEKVRWVLERGEEWIKEHPPTDWSNLKLDHLFGADTVDAKETN